ncbi:MAG: filamentous hemagglutinin N-terminal domain-containing protein, partial [Methylococcaceae bacterium]
MNTTFLPFLQKSLVIAISAILANMATSVANAQDALIKLDGTTGTSGSISLSPNPVTLITKIDGGGVTPNGTVNGSNLFFSFSDFGVQALHTALFTCTTGCTGVNNVISRVSGVGSDHISDINGKLTSNIGTANFWFFNPNGVIFGAGAEINVPAAFHIGTANSLSFSSGSLPSTPTEITSTLVSGNPTSFCFSGSAGDITINGSNITIAGGSTEIASAKDISINNGAHITASSEALDISAQGNLTIDNASKITASNSGDSHISAGSTGSTTIDSTHTSIGSVSATGGNLRVAAGGIIEKTDGAGELSVAAKSGSVANTGKVTVTGTTSAINTTSGHTGAATIAGDTALLVDQLGAINLANGGAASVTAGTSLDVGNATGTVGQEGTITATN